MNTLRYMVIDKNDRTMSRHHSLESAVKAEIKHDAKWRKVYPGALFTFQIVHNATYRELNQDEYKQAQAIWQKEGTK